MATLTAEEVFLQAVSLDSVVLIVMNRVELEPGHGVLVVGAQEDVHLCRPREAAVPLRESADEPADVDEVAQWHVGVGPVRRELLPNRLEEFALLVAQADVPLERHRVT